VHTHLAPGPHSPWEASTGAPCRAQGFNRGPLPRPRLQPGPPAAPKRSTGAPPPPRTLSRGPLIRPAPFRGPSSTRTLGRRALQGLMGGINGHDHHNFGVVALSPRAEAATLPKV